MYLSYLRQQQRHPVLWEAVGEGLLPTDPNGSIKRNMQLHRPDFRRSPRIAKDHAENFHAAITTCKPSLKTRFLNSITEFVGIYRRDRVEQAASLAIMWDGVLNEHTFLKNARSLEFSYTWWHYYRTLYTTTVCYEDLIDTMADQPDHERNPDKGDLTEYRRLYKTHWPKSRLR